LCFSSPGTSIPFFGWGNQKDVAEPEAMWHLSAGAMEAARGNKMSDTVPRVLMKGSAPGMVVKQVVNVLQLMYASRRLAEGDRRERRRARATRLR
jgi:hypothetical protein